MAGKLDKGNIVSETRTVTVRLPMFTEDELLAISREFILNEHRLSEPICRKIDEELSRRKGEHRV